jgi:hypothetical protein
MGRFPTFIAKLACVAVLTHVGFSGFLALLTEHCFAHRMVNIRALENQDMKARTELIASFLNAVRRDERPLIGFFGSSFSFGYPFPPSAPMSGETCSAFPDHRVVNVSVLGASLEGIQNSLTLAELQGCRFETVVVEIPVINELSNFAGSAASWRIHFAEAKDRLTEVHDTTYFQWYFRRPAGVHYLAAMFEELTLSDGDIPLSLVQPSDGYFMSAKTFESVRDEYSDKIRLTLETAKRIGNRVIAFPTPVFLAGGDRIRYDTAAVREQIESTEEACRSVAGVTALRLEPRFLNDKALFYNLTHYGLRGNREFGSWIAGEIGRPAGSESVADRSTPGGERR